MGQFPLLSAVITSAGIAKNWGIVYRYSSLRCHTWALSPWAWRTWLGMKESVPHQNGGPVRGCGDHPLGTLRPGEATGRPTSFLTKTTMRTVITSMTANLCTTALQVLKALSSSYRSFFAPIFDIPSRL